MRLNINVSDELLVRIDKYADSLGVSRSALCTMLIGQGVMNYEKSMQIIDQFGLSLVDSELKALRASDSAAEQFFLLCYYLTIAQKAVKN